MPRTTRPEPFSVELAASELPESLVARFRERPAANERFTVTVEQKLTEAEKLDVLRRDIAEGLADLDAGKISDADEVFHRLDALFPNS